MKAQMQQEEATQQNEQTPNPTPPNTSTKPPDTKTDEKPPENNSSNTNPSETPSKPPENQTEQTQTKIPETIHLEGIGEITIDELRKGYLRNKDYTQKTQEVSRQRKEAEEAIEFVRQIKENPEVLQQMASGQAPQQFDPLIQKILELEASIYDMKIEKEIDYLQNKYDDFDVREVLEIAHSKKILNLEDAYLLSKSAKNPSSNTNINIEELKQQIRKEVLKELEADAETTRTIITPGNDGAVYEDNTPKLTDKEKKVAKHMFKDSKNPYAEYAKWKNVKS
jgi:hypothetical protein